MQMMAKQSSFTPLDQTKIKFFGIGALLLAAWAWTFWSTLVSMEVVWRGSETYMHCYFIPLISLWLIWPLRHAINPQSFGSLWGLLLFIPSFMLWLVGFAADVNLIAHFGAMLCLVSLLWCWLGDSNFKVLRFPLIYLLFAVPFGEEANAPLQFITAEMAVWLLQMTGIPVLHEGLYITTPVASFEVAEACSGVRFMIVALALAFLFSHMHFQGWKKRALFIGSLVILSIIANSFRAFFLIFIGEKSGMTYGFGADHYYYGWAFFAIVIFLSFHIGAKFGDKNEVDYEQSISLKSRKVFPPITALLLVLICKLWISSLQPLTPAMTVFSDKTSQTQDNLKEKFGIEFPYSHKSKIEQVNDNLLYFSVIYELKQINGELISSNNRLYDTTRWAVMDKSITVQNEIPLTHVTLRNPQGQVTQLVFTYQISEKYFNSAYKAKFYQAYLFLIASSGKAKIHAVYCSEIQVTECTVTLIKKLEDSKGLPLQ